MNIGEIKQALRNQMFQELSPAAIRGGNRVAIMKEIQRTLRRMRIRIDASQRDALIQEIIDDLLGYGPIQALIEDPSISEIMVNGPDRIYYEQHGQQLVSDLRFDDAAHLTQLILKMAQESGSRIDEASPTLDLSLKGGERVNCVLPPIATKGPYITVRKMTTRVEGIEQLVMNGTLNPPMSQFLWGCIKAGINMMFSGATGAGKTTLMQILSNYIDEGERIITIEDTPELQLKQRHVVPLQSRPKNIEGKGEITLRELFHNTLRMRPNRIILGELRGPEAFDYLQAITSGHQGSLAVIHAASPEEVILRLENLAQMAGVSIPPNVLRGQIAHGLQLIIQLARLKDGARKVMRISEVTGVVEGQVMVRDLFRFEEQGIDAQGQALGHFRAMGVEPGFFPRFHQMGLDIDPKIFQAR